MGGTTVGACPRPQYNPLVPLTRVALLSFIALITMVNPLAVVPSFIALTDGASRRTRQAWTTAATVSSFTLTFTETPSGPGGLLLYRVLSIAGAAYLPTDNLSVSAPNNNDFANVVSYTYENLTNTTIKAQHLIELRQAVNALCDAAGASQEYPPSELQLSAIQGTVVRAQDFISLMTHINNIRTNALIGVAAASFTDTPAVNGTINRQHVQGLRDELR